MCFAKSRRLAKFVGNATKQRLEYFNLYNLKIHDISVNLYVSRKRATKSTHIHCAESGDIIINTLLSASTTQYLNPEMLITAINDRFEIFSENLTEEYYSILRTSLKKADLSEFF